MQARSRSSESIYQSTRSIIPGGVNSPLRSFSAVGGSPFIVDRCEGPFLFDVEGNRYVDFVMGWGSLVLGHGATSVTQALEHQLTRGISYGMPSELETELAELIVNQIPSVEMIRFLHSRTEATISALRLARTFTERDRIIKFAGCYHGHGENLLDRAGSGVAALGIAGTAGVPKQVALQNLTAQYNDLDSVSALFESYPDEIAAIIIEPVASNCGLIAPRDGFLNGLRELADHYGALLIFDETASGFRASPRGAQELYGVRPDLTTFGKVIGGGLPIGALGGKREIMSLVAPLGPVYQSSSLAGNPLVMAAGLATLKKWLAAGVFDEAAAVSETLISAVIEIAAEKGIELSATSLGTMFGFFFSSAPVFDSETAGRADTDRFKRFFRLALSKGLFFPPSQFEASFICRAHRGEALNYTLSALSEVFGDMVREERNNGIDRDSHRQPSQNT